MGLLGRIRGTKLGSSGKPGGELRADAQEVIAQVRADLADMPVVPVEVTELSAAGMRPDLSVGDTPDGVSLAKGSADDVFTALVERLKEDHRGEAPAERTRQAYFGAGDYTKAGITIECVSFSKKAGRAHLIYRVGESTYCLMTRPY